MEEYVANQIKYGLKYLPSNFAKSYFIKSGSEETKAFRKKGFIRGVCHPREDFDLLNEANIDWIRVDMPFPFDKDGNITPNYEGFKDKCRRYLAHGIKSMIVTPYPGDYTEFGIDVTSAEGLKKVAEIAEFIITDMQGVAGAFQITNEMGIPRFTIPLTMRQATDFIAVQLEAMAPLKKDILVGYNSAGPQADLHTWLKPYHKYCDYVGMDIYLGCFGDPSPMFFYEAMLRYLWALTGKPVLLQEFGYIGAGKPKTKQQKIDILNKYGIKDFADAKKNTKKLVDNLPEGFNKRVKQLSEGSEERYYNLLFKSDLNAHLYTELSKLSKMPGFEHTPEGQAKFFNTVLPKLYSLDFVCGTIIYCWSDSDRCYVCGQEDCPTETRWGLVTCDNKPKPAFYAVKKQFSKIKWFENTEKK